MQNEILLLIETVFIFSSLLLVKKLFGKYGVIAWVSFAAILANIQTAKSVDMFGVSTVLGNVLFASTFLATDILSECYGKEESKKAVYISFFAVILFIISNQICLLYSPNGIDFANESMNTLFSTTFRISASSVIMFFIANMADVILFDKLKTKFNGKHLWLRNNLSTIVCNCIENFMFMMIAFIGVYEFKEIISIAISTSIIETIIALCDTPFLYLAKHKTKG